MIKSIAYCAGLFLFTHCTSPKAVTSTPKSSAADSLAAGLKRLQQKGYFNGFAVAIVNEKGTLYQSGTGYADVAAKRAYTTTTIQNIGSISKTFIGIALLKAQEMGKLQLDDHISKYLPFKVVNPYYPAASITIRQLATHTSGIMDNDYYLQKSYVLKPGQDLSGLPLQFDDQPFNAPDSMMPMSAFLQNLLSTGGKWYSKEGFIDYKPGERFEYTNIGATLAAYIVELATGIPFDVFTTRYILKPLQMTASGWKFDQIEFSNYSRLYGDPQTLLPYYSLITYPDGNFISSINDMGKYLTELIRGYAGTGTLLTKASYAELFREQLNASHFEKRNEKNPYNDSYNMGIFMGSSAAGNIGHTGGDPGVTTMMFFNPETKTGRLLILNTNFHDKGGNDTFFAIWDKLGQYQDKF